MSKTMEEVFAEHARRQHAVVQALRALTPDGALADLREVRGLFCAPNEVGHALWALLEQEHPEWMPWMRNWLEAGECSNQSLHGPLGQELVGMLLTASRERGLVGAPEPTRETGSSHLIAWSVLHGLEDVLLSFVRTCTERPEWERSYAHYFHYFRYISGHIKHSSGLVNRHVALYDLDAVEAPLTEASFGTLVAHCEGFSSDDPAAQALEWWAMVGMHISPLHNHSMHWLGRITEALEGQRDLSTLTTLLVGLQVYTQMFDDLAVRIWRLPTINADSNFRVP